MALDSVNQLFSEFYNFILNCRNEKFVQLNNGEQG